MTSFHAFKSGMEMTAIIPYYFQVCHIPALDVLYLNQEEGKKISSFPEAELEFMSVSELHMECNSLTCIPSLISTMPGIQKLFLNDNQIQTLPTELCELKHIQVLRKFLSTCVVISLHCDCHFIYFISRWWSNLVLRPIIIYFLGKTQDIPYIWF